MGLMDVLNGMQNGPRGGPSSGGMSPVTMAVIGLLAYKAYKNFTNQPGGAPAGAGRAAPPAQGQGGGLGGGLGDLLKNGLGGILAGGAAGSVLSGGLNDLLKQLQQGGQGGAANSWVGNGPNKAISADELSKVLNSDQLKTLMQQTGLSSDQLLSALSQHLPGLVDALTPNGRVPTEQELSQLLK